MLQEGAFVRAYFRRVEHAGEDRAQPVEQDLHGEDAEEVHRDIELVTRRHERLGPDEPRREDDGEHGDVAQKHQQYGEEVVLNYFLLRKA